MQNFPFQIRPCAPPLSLKAGPVPHASSGTGARRLSTSPFCVPALVDALVGKGNVPYCLVCQHLLVQGCWGMEVVWSSLKDCCNICAVPKRKTALVLVVQALLYTHSKSMCMDPCSDARHMPCACLHGYTHACISLDTCLSACLYTCLHAFGLGIDGERIRAQIVKNISRA